MIKNPSSHDIWVEKYRPQTLDDYIGNEQMVDKIKEFIDLGKIPHLLFQSASPGTGKTTIAKVISNSLNADVMYINASDENNVDTMRTKIKSFASTTSFKDIKIVVLDESDFLTASSQSVLRNMLETYSDMCRFIFTCNYIDRIILPIQSRCQCFKVIPPSKKDVALRMIHILKTENIQFNKEDVVAILTNSFPDIRSCIQNMQMNIKGDTLVLDKKNLLAADYIEKIVEVVKGKSKDKFNEIRKIIADNQIKEFTPLFKQLYDDVESYATGKENLIITCIADAVVDCAMVVDKEIVVMSMFGKILKSLS